MLENDEDQMVEKDQGWLSNDVVTSFPISANERDVGGISRTSSRKQSRRGSREFRPMSRSNKGEPLSVHFMPFYGSGNSSPVQTAHGIPSIDKSPNMAIKKHLSPQHSPNKLAFKPRIAKSTIREF